MKNSEKFWIIFLALMLTLAGVFIRLLIVVGIAVSFYLMWIS